MNTCHFYVVGQILLFVPICNESKDNEIKGVNLVSPRSSLGPYILFASLMYEKCCSYSKYRKVEQSLEGNVWGRIRWLENPTETANGFTEEDMRLGTLVAKLYKSSIFQVEAMLPSWNAAVPHEMCFLKKSLASSGGSVKLLSIISGFSRSNISLFSLTLFS